jgi:hypothetical protein
VRCGQHTLDVYLVNKALVNPIIDACNLHGKVSVYEEHGGIALAQEEGQAIAKALGDNMACILQNHGYYQDNL